MKDVTIEFLKSANKGAWENTPEGSQVVFTAKGQEPRAIDGVQLYNLFRHVSDMVERYKPEPRQSVKEGQAAFFRPKTLLEQLSDMFQSIVEKQERAAREREFSQLNHVHRLLDDAIERRPV